MLLSKGGGGFLDVVAEWGGGERAFSNLFPIA